jgi:hypothetical protein
MAGEFNLTDNYQNTKIFVAEVVRVFEQDVSFIE